MFYNDTIEGRVRNVLRQHGLTDKRRAKLATCEPEGLSPYLLLTVSKTAPFDTLREDFLNAGLTYTASPNDRQFRFTLADNTGFSLTLEGPGTKPRTIELGSLRAARRVLAQDHDYTQATLTWAPGASATATLDETTARWSSTHPDLDGIELP
jgi:hypothetical protein